MTRERIRSSESVRFTALLKEEGCPICRVTAHSDDRFFFWFFAEQYYTFHMLDLLTRSHRVLRRPRRAPCRHPDRGRVYRQRL